MPTKEFEIGSHLCGPQSLQFHRATISENWSYLGTDNVRGEISEHIFAPSWRLLFIHFPSTVLILV